MRRGDLVTVALQGNFRKPCPALVIQADPFSHLGTVTVLLVTGTFVEAPLLRVSLDPDETNGLRKPSQVMIHKAMTVRRERLGPVFGSLKPEDILRVWRCLVVFLGGA